MQGAFLKQIADGHVFKSIDCLNRVQVPENKSVLFSFDCKPGTVCLVQPAFLVVVNVVEGYVVAVVDPYIPSSGPQPSGYERAQFFEGPGGIPIIDKLLSTLLEIVRFQALPGKPCGCDQFKALNSSDSRSDGLLSHLLGQINRATASVNTAAAELVAIRRALRRSALGPRTPRLRPRPGRGVGDRRDIR